MLERRKQNWSAMMSVLGLETNSTSAVRPGSSKYIEILSFITKY